MARGTTPGSLGLRSTAANVDAARIEHEFGAGFAEKIGKLAPGQWQELETAERLLLVRLTRVYGGLPPPHELRPRLVAGWKGEVAQKALTAATRRVTDRYRVEETSR